MVISIEETMLRAQEAAEPGDMKNLGRSDAGPVKLNSLTSAGWVKVWDTRTGEESICNRNMLLDQLKKKRPDGSAIFTTDKPNIQPFRGTLKCLLHADDPNRKHYNELGLATCQKSNLTSKYQVERHMAKRHPAEYATIKEELAREEKAEERNFQRAIIAQAQNIANPKSDSDGEIPWGELKSKASGMGINTKGMKRAEVEAAIKAKQETGNAGTQS